MKLVYINDTGTNWLGKYIYEFLFAESCENIDGEDWDACPAAGQPSAPDSSYIDKVGLMMSDIKLDLIQNDDRFAVWDSVDGIVALGWENIDDYDQYPDHRLAFHFGENIEKIEDKLYTKDIILNYNNVDKIHKQ